MAGEVLFETLRRPPRAGERVRGAPSPGGAAVGELSSVRWSSLAGADLRGPTGLSERSGESRSYSPRCMPTALWHRSGAARVMCASRMVTVLPYSSVKAAAVAPDCCRLRTGGSPFAGWPSGPERNFCFWQSSFKFAISICSLARRMMPARSSSWLFRSGLTRLRPRLKTSRPQLSTPPLKAANASFASTCLASAPSSARPMPACAEFSLLRPTAASCVGEPARSAFFSRSWRHRFLIMLGLLTNTSRSSICSI
mmetsp:Transcript_33284/g.103767  ORF Transcript_33284/g.103767 Transcript_33284/m.103767 type:complete len:254 (-) Transcript_33284:170-931(-)